MRSEKDNSNPGGRRYVAIDGRPKYLTLYEFEKSQRFRKRRMARPRQQRVE